jgi:integrase
MASVIRETKNDKVTYRIQFRDAQNRRRKLRLPKSVNNKRSAETIARRISHLVSATVAGEPPEPEVAKWLVGISDDLHQRISQFGLCLLRSRQTLSGFADQYLTEHLKQTGASSENNLRRTEALLVEHFGGDVPISEITSADAKNFRIWLSEERGYKEATVAGHIKRSKQIFKAAADSGVIPSSPFTGVKVGSQVNDDRSEYVPAEIVDRVIDASHCAEMRLLIALSRYGGLRIPVEARRLLWTDIDFEKGEMTIRGKKNKHGQVRRRVCPIFPQLRPYLEDCFDPEQTHVINRYRTTNPRTQMERLIKRADVDRWERLFHNMRGSLQTDLYAAGFELHAVCSWLGNSPEVAIRHYLKVTQEMRTRASEFKVGQQVGPQPAATADMGGNGLQPIPLKLGESANLRVSSCTSTHPGGLEPPTLGSEDRCSIQLSYGCKSGAQCSLGKGNISVAAKSCKAVVNPRNPRKRAAAGLSDHGRGRPYPNNASLE